MDILPSSQSSPETILLPQKEAPSLCTAGFPPTGSSYSTQDVYGNNTFQLKIQRLKEKRRGEEQNQALTVKGAL